TPRGRSQTSGTCRPTPRSTTASSMVAERLARRAPRFRSAVVARPLPGALPLVEGPGHVVLQRGAGGVRVDADEVPGADMVRGGVPCRLQELVRAVVLAAG